MHLQPIPERAASPTQERPGSDNGPPQPGQVANKKGGEVNLAAKGCRRQFPAQNGEHPELKLRLRIQEVKGVAANFFVAEDLFGSSAE
jgi:hypothetical protein